MCMLGALIGGAPISWDHLAESGWRAVTTPKVRQDVTLEAYLG